MSDAPDRILVEWLIDRVDQPPRHGLERALAATRRTNQRPRWTYLRTWFAPTGVLGSVMARYAVITVLVVVSATAVLGFMVRQGGVGGPTGPIAPAMPSPSPSASPEPTPTPSPSLSPGYGSAPPDWPTPGPFAPATPFPDPAGSPIPSDLIGRVYNANPMETQGNQALVLTLRSADDPHCVAMFDGRSTCFTILWAPNYPKHIFDPGVRGPARLVGENLVLGFALVPNDLACEGTSSTYAVSPDGWTLSGIDVPACSFPGFVRH